MTLRTVEPSPTAVVPATTTWTEFPRLCAVLLDQVWAFLRSDAPMGLWTHGHNVMLYQDDVPHVEVGVQVTGTFDPHGQVVPSTLPGGPAATATHIGPIAGIGDTHRAVCDWATANGYTLTRQRWEIYGDPDPATNAVEVEVYWSLMAPQRGLIHERWYLFWGLAIYCCHHGKPSSHGTPSCATSCAPATAHSPSRSFAI